MSSLSCDNFGLWLSNRDLFDKLNDDTLKSNQDVLISFFGGFRAVLNLCIKDQYNLDLRKQQKLFKLLNSITTKQSKQLSCNTESISSEIGQLHLESQKKQLSMLHMHDICISLIFTFFKQSDHLALQKTCKSLSIIGRRKESFETGSHTFEFNYYLETEHRLPHIIEYLKSDDAEQWSNALDILQSFETRCHIQKVMHSGILPLLFRICTKRDFTFCCDVIFLVEKWMQNDSYPYHLLTKYGLFNFIKALIANGNSNVTIELFGIISSLVKKDKSSVISLNHLQVFPVLFGDILRKESDTLPTGFLRTTFYFISSQSFDWNCSSNKTVIEMIARHLLLKLLRVQLNDTDEYDIEDLEDEFGDESDDDDNIRDDIYLKQIYEILAKKQISTVDIVHFRETAAISCDISDFFYHLVNQDYFVSFINDQLDRDRDFAVTFILSMLNNQKECERLFDISANATMIQKLIRCCYSSTKTIALECCLALSSNCSVDDGMILAEYGIAYAFQDFISYFKDYEEHHGLLCHVIKELETYVKRCSIVRQQLCLDQKMRTHFLENDLYSEQVKKAVRECELIWS